MTNQEAAEMIRNDMKLHHDSLSGQYRKALNMAISALQAQDSPKPTVESVQNVQNEDLISRKAAIDETWKEPNYTDPINVLTEIRDRLRALPSAQPEPQWISVTERLPESKPEDLEYPTVIACCEDGEVMTACYYESTKEWGIGENYDRKINPVAWMPLPEPYRAERRTDEADYRKE